MAENMADKNNVNLENNMLSDDELSMVSGGTDVEYVRSMRCKNCGTIYSWAGEHDGETLSCQACGGETEEIDAGVTS